MLLAFIILYALSLLYVCATERFRHYALLVGLQGWLLLAIALMQLGNSSPLEQIFIVTETLVFKGILVPYLLFRIIRQNQVNKAHRIAIPTFISVMISIVALVCSLWITSFVASTGVNTMFLGIALFGLLTGLIMITTHRRIFSHMIGFLVIENTVMLLSLAVGIEMPMLINVGVLLDILMGVLILGIFINKIGSRIHSLDSGELTRLKD
ncbi:MAG: hypothetical protein RR931_02055 [Mucinivorans sp.]